ncbi:hypothetical protein DRN43_05625 [Thermococci archaeon]|nr:MAG: hypothetical protein DRN43_05625 [Thermococci archaeon]
MELTKLEMRLKVEPKEAQKLQYELSKSLATYRVSINGSTKKAIIIFDESRLSKKELLDLLKNYEPEIAGMEHLTIEELIESSMSWRNVRGIEG